MKTQKRRNPRISTDLLAQVEILPERTQVLGRLVNLNKESVLFRTDHRVDPGTKVNVRFNLPPVPPGVAVQVEGVVVHSKEGVHMGIHMGIQFSPLQEAYANAIAKYIESRSS